MELLQAVSIASDGPCKASAKEILFANIALADLQKTSNYFEEIKLNSKNGKNEFKESQI